MSDGPGKKLRGPRLPPWAPRRGDPIEIRLPGQPVQACEVDEVMPDGSGFWIKPDGIHQRRYLRVDDAAYQVWA